MHLNRHEDKHGAFYKLGMIERSALTLENYAGSQFGSRFYTEDFLAGICQQRNNLHQKTSKTVSALVLLTTVLAFYDSINGTFILGGISFSLPAAGAAALCVLVSFNFFATLLAFLDQLLIDRYVSTLGNRISIHSFELSLLNYTALNLWADAIQPKYFGLASSTGHKLVSPIAGLFVAILILAGMAYPLTIVGFTMFGLLKENPSILEIALCTFSIFVFAFSIFFLISFSLSYRFRPSGTSEPGDIFVPEDFLDLGHPRQDTQSSDQKAQTG